MKGSIRFLIIVSIGLTLMTLNGNYKQGSLIDVIKTQVQGVKR